MYKSQEPTYHIEGLSFARGSRALSRPSLPHIGLDLAPIVSYDCKKACKLKYQLEFYILSVSNLNTIMSYHDVYKSTL